MDLLFGGDFDYGRGGLVLVGLGMGFHLVGGHAQPGRAGPRPRRAAAAAWLAAPRSSSAGCALAPLDDQLLRGEVGYCATTAVLALALWLIERSSTVRA